MDKEWITPEELAQLTGYSRQTVNKWIKREGWITAPKPGVQGGRARVILLDDHVRAFIGVTCHVNVAEPIPEYARPDKLVELLISFVGQMNKDEKEELTAFLLRSGLKGLLQRIKIQDIE